MGEQKSNRGLILVIFLFFIIAAVIVFIFLRDDSTSPYTPSRPNNNYSTEIALNNIDDYIDYIALDEDTDKLDYYVVKIYDAFYSNIDNIKAGVNTISLAECGWTDSELNEVVYYISEATSGALSTLFFDNPELFYLSFDSMEIKIDNSRFTNDINDIVFSRDQNFYEEYFTSQQQIDSAINQMREARQQIYESMPQGLNDYEIVTYLNDYLVDNVEYDVYLYRPLIHTAYGALVNGVAVCDGYAYALEYLLDGLGITNLVGAGYVVDESSPEGEGHMWSYVELYGNWYGVDVTWNDPVVIDPTLSPEEIELIKEENKHNYLLVGGDLDLGTGFYAEGRTPENYIYYFGDLYYKLPVPEISTTSFVYPIFEEVNVNEQLLEDDIIGYTINISASAMMDNYTFAYAVSTDGGVNYSNFIACDSTLTLDSIDDNGMYKIRIQTNEGEEILMYDQTITIQISQPEDAVTQNVKVIADGVYIKEDELLIA